MVHMDSSYIRDNNNPPYKTYIDNPDYPNVTRSSVDKRMTRQINKTDNNLYPITSEVGNTLPDREGG